MSLLEFTTNSVYSYNTFIHYTLIAVNICSELEHFSNKALDFSVPKNFQIDFST